MPERSSQSENIVGIDVGGSKIAAVSIDVRTGMEQRQFRIATPSSGPLLLAGLAEAFDAVGAGAAVGVAVPAPVAGDGSFSAAPNLPALAEVGGVAGLASAFDVPLRVGNDAKCAALAEARYGAGVGARSMLMVAVGTGIGGGFVADGRVQIGSTGAAGEIGHLEVSDNGVRCGCGRFGCAEAMASGTALAAAAERLYGVRDGRDLIRGVLRHDDAAMVALNRWAEVLVRAIAMATFVLDPEVIVLGGGVFDPAEPALSYVQRALAASAPGPRARWPELRSALLGNRAAAIGAAALAAE